WLPVLWPSTQLIILTTAVGLGVSPLASQELARELRQVRAALGNAANPPTRLFPLQTPLAAFHLSMWRRAPGRRPPPDGAVAALIHVRGRAWESEMLARGAEFGLKLQHNIWDYLLSARLFCRYGPGLHAIPMPLRRALLANVGSGA